FHGLGVLIGKVGQQDEPTDVVQQSGCETFLCHAPLLPLDLRDAARGVGHRQAVAIHLLHLLLRPLAEFQFRKNVYAQHERLDRFEPKLHHGFVRVAKLAAQPEERGIDQLQHFGRHRRVLRNQLADPLDRRVRRSQFPENLKVKRRQTRHTRHLRYQYFQPLVVQPVLHRQRALDGRAQHFGIARLAQELVGPAHALHGHLHVRITREDEADGARIFLHDFVQQFRAVHAGHPHVRDHHVGGVFGHQLQRFLPASGEMHVRFLAEAVKHALQTRQDHRLVINQKNLFHGASFLLAGGEAGWIGRRIMNVVPCPILESKVRSPPCFVTMVARASARPWPVPLPTSLVVKNGSKIRCRIVSGMPRPVSETRISTFAPTCRVVMRMVPFAPARPLIASAIVCAALTSRFKITWLNSPGRQGTAGKAGSKSVTTSATYFHSLRATVIVVWMALFTSVSTFSAVPGCENSFIALTIAATRLTPSSDCCNALGISVFRNGWSISWLTASAAAIASAAGGWARATSAMVRCASIRRFKSLNASATKRRLSPTYWMGVLISWAMPAANCPTDSSFCAWRSWTSMRLRSACSRFWLLTSTRNPS